MNTNANANGKSDDASKSDDPAYAIHEREARCREHALELGTWQFGK
jgi:hypothetical protein